MELIDSTWLIYLGAAILLVAYAIRDELKLRVMIVASTLVYIAYYYVVSDSPLWDAIFTSAAMIAINLWVLGQLVLERTTLSLSEDEKRLFDAFETLSPGQFRRILRLAKWQRGEDPEGTLLIREDEPSGALLYIFEGIVSVEKNGRQFRLPEGNFLGEVAYVLNRKTTTTAVAPQGVRWVEWDADALRRVSARHAALGNALNALLTRDLAKKLNTSYRPDDALPATPASRELLEVAEA